jgi:hypothetical protein
VKSFTFDTPTGKTTVKLDVNDDFKPDNFAYISTPEKGSTNIMLITNSNEKYLVAALEVMNKISVNKNSPPIVVFNNPDVIILGDVNKEVMIPGDITRIKQLVRDQGIPLIILAQDDLMKLPLTDMFPLELIKSTPQSVTDIVVPTNRDSYLTPSEIQFGQTRKLYETKENENVNVIAQTTKVKYPVITISTYGKGKIMYYGLFDEYSDFKSDIYYPIFWKRSLDLLLGGKTLAELNKKTGFMETLGKEESVNTPKGVVKGSAITLDYAGIYEFDNYNVAANILNEEEQRLNKDTLSLEASKLSIESKAGKEEKKEKDLTLTLVYILAALFIIEYFYLKIRGDI